MYVFYKIFFPKKLVLKFHTLKQGCGVITVYDVTWNFRGKLSPFLMSVPQTPHSKFGVVKKRVKKLGKKLAFQSGTKKSLYCFFPGVG